MKILLLRTWLTNIGNGFIDKGGHVAVERAVPDADIVEVSGYPNLINQRLQNRYNNLFRNVLSTLPGGWSPSILEASTPMESYSNADMIDADVAVLPGCVLHPHALDPYLPTLRNLHDRNIPIILLGAGGNDYSEETQRYVRSVLNELDIKVLITRDETAFECYSDSVEFAYDGIDCGFYINEWYDGGELDGDFVAVTLDKIDEPPIDTEYEIRRIDHAPWGSPYTILSQIFGKASEPHPRFRSDLLEDYLMLYANAHLTVSDRIHACVPALAYGNSARFQYDTPRARLFDKVFNENVVGETVRADQDRLSKLKEQQVNTLRSSIDQVV